MSNQQSQKPVLPKHSTKLDRLGKSDGYLLLRSVTFFALLADAFAVEIWSHISQTTSTAWKNNCGIVAPLRMARLGCQADLPLVEIGKFAIGHEMSNQQWWLPATTQLHRFCPIRSLLTTILDRASWWRVASKTSKPTTALRPASNWTGVPLAMKFQINN